MARSEGREPIWLVDILSRTRKGFGRGSACGAYGKQQSLCGQMESNCQLAYNSTNWMPRTATAAKRYTTSRRYKFPGEEVEIHAYIYTEAGSFMTWLAPSFFSIWAFYELKGTEGWTCPGKLSFEACYQVFFGKMPECTNFLQMRGGASVLIDVTKPKSMQKAYPLAGFYGREQQTKILEIIQMSNQFLFLKSGFIP